MGCGETIGPVAQTIQVYTTSDIYVWYTNWMLLHGMTEVDAVLATHNLSGTSWRGKPDEHVHNGLGYSLLRGDWVFR